MPINATPRSKRLFRLRTILMVVILSVLLLPLASLYFFRFYENELVRKTEIELISQSAAFSAVYRELIQHNHTSIEGEYSPVIPQLDLATQTILPRRPAAVISLHQSPEYLLAQQAGNRMQTILRNTQEITLAGIRILDQNGIVIAGRNEVGQSLAHVYEVQIALTGQYASVLRERLSKDVQPSVASLSRGTGIRVFTAFPIMDQGQIYGVVYLSRTPQNILKHLYGIKEKVAVLALLLLGMTVLIVLFISSRLSRPIRELVEQAQKVTKGEIETVGIMNKPGTYELAELSSSFAEMSQTLQERSQYIQQFASHVSHEFKTPLTSMQGSLELMQEHIDDMPKDQQQRFLTNLQADTERLKDLVNRLLEQAHADVLQSSAETSNLLHILTTLKPRYADAKLTLIYDDNMMEQDINIAANALESILCNLFDNSLQHGATQVDLSLIQHNKQLQLSVQDNGSGISESNKKRIFTPFFTTRRDNGGTGLGLGIIESSLKTWGGSIQLKDSESGTLFVLQFKCGL